MVYSTRIWLPKTRQSCATISRFSKNSFKACDNRPEATMSIVLAASGVCLAGMKTQKNCAASCSLEGAAPRKRRRQPPNFGHFVPAINNRAFSSDGKAPSPASGIIDRAEKECPLCRKFSRGPCGNIFTDWLKCTDQNPGKDVNGEALHLTTCRDFASKLAKCLEEYDSYYQSDENDENTAQGTKDHDVSTLEEVEMLNETWNELVKEVETNIGSGEYQTLPFPQSIQPRMEIRLQTKKGAAFFKSEIDDGVVLFVAYIQDQDGKLLAAGSKDDMDMGKKLGCVLQFDIIDGTKSTTAHAIYDVECGDPTRVYFRTEMIPSR